jgi:hypothetical protein
VNGGSSNLTNQTLIDVIARPAMGEQTPTEKSKDRDGAGVKLTCKSPIPVTLGDMCG